MQITSKDICNSFDPLPKFNILGFQSLFTPQDYITKGKTIKNIILKNVIKNEILTYVVGVVQSTYLTSAFCLNIQTNYFDTIPTYFYLFLGQEYFQRK